MEDDRIKELFGRFDPPMSSDNKFMEHLTRSLKAVEEVRRRNVELRRRCRVAVAVAALTGFLVGVVLTLLMPYAGDFVAGLGRQFMIFGINISSFNYQIAGWLVIGGASVLTALNAYEIALSRLTAGEEKAM